MTRWDVRRWLPSVLAPIAALAIAVAISSIVLAVAGKSPGLAYSSMFNYAFTGRSGPDSMTDILNRATGYYLAAVAVALGFRMGLFNIGVDGQYRLATLLAGALGAASFLAPVPGPIKIIIMIVVAMAVGAIWSGIAGLLKVFRGISEVISTIMLNFVGGSIFALLLTTKYLGVQRGQSVTTTTLPDDAHLPGLAIFPTRAHVYSFIIIAALVGVGYWFLLARTRFGFDLRASGLNPFAAKASGVSARRMIVVTMLISGAIAGLVGLPQLLGHDYTVTTNLGGIGFTGIAIALLGRNHPVGIAFAALLWAFLDRTRIILDLNDIPQEIVVIMQGVTVLAVVVAYEVAGRFRRRAQQRSVGAVAATDAVSTPQPPTPQPPTPQQPTEATA